MRDFPDYRQLRYIEHLILKDITRDLKYKTLELCSLLEKKESELSGVDRETLSKLREIISDYENAKANMEKLSNETLAEFEKILDKFMNESDVTEFIKEHFSNQIEGLVETALTDAKNSGEFDGASISITDIVESDNDGGYNIITFSDGNVLRIRNGKGGSGTGGEVVKNYFSVVSHLTNVVSNTNLTEIEENASYTATLSTVGTMESVVITMGGVDITSTVYNSETGVINIPSVTAHIIITASAVLDSTKIYYTLTRNFTGLNNSSDTVQVEEGEGVIIILTPLQNYSMQSVTVRMGGVDITSTVYDSGTHTVDIPSVTGDVVITAIAELVVTTYTITYNFGGHCMIDSAPTQINEGESYIHTLSFDSGYMLDSCTLTMGGADANSYFDAETLTINIPSVTGNIVLTVTAKEETVVGTYTNILSATSITQNKKWNWSAKNSVDATDHCFCAIGSITTPCTLYFKNIETVAGSQCALYCFGTYIGDFDGGKYIEITATDPNATWWEDGNLKSYYLNSSFSGFYAGIQAKTITSDSIVTRNEPIP